MKNRMINLLAFGALTLLWLAFLAALLFNRELLATTWLAFRGWTVIAQLTAGLLALPVVLGLWIWQTSWPEWLRLILIAGLAWASVYTFFPKKSPRQTSPSPVALEDQP
jgi:hypothetical protein